MGIHEAHLIVGALSVGCANGIEPATLAHYSQVHPMHEKGGPTHHAEVYVYDTVVFIFLIPGVSVRLCTKEAIQMLSGLMPLAPWQMFFFRLFKATRPYYQVSTKCEFLTIENLLV